MEGRNRSSLLVLALLSLAGLALRFIGLGDWPLWYDEAFSAVHVREFSWELLIRDGTRNPPLYILLLWPWVAVFGEGEVSVRALSALVGGISIPVFYLTAKELFDRQTGLIAAALFLLAPVHVYYSQEGRCYVILLLVVAFFYLFLFRALNHLRIQDWVAVAVAGISGLYIHYSMGLALLASCCVLLLWQKDARLMRRYRLYSLTMAVVGLAIVPWLVFCFLIRKPVLLPPYWIDEVGVVQAARQSLETLTLGRPGSGLWKQFLVLDEFRAGHYVGLLCVAVLLASVVWEGIAMRDADRERSRRLLQVCGLAVLPCLLLWIASRTYAPIYQPGRYDLVAFVPVVLLMAKGAAYLRQVSRVACLAVVTPLLILYALTLQGYFAQPVALPWSYPGKQIARVLAEQLEPGDVVLLSDHGIAARYYAPRYGLNWRSAECELAGGQSIPCRLVVPRSRMGAYFEFEQGTRSDRPELVEPYIEDLLSMGATAPRRIWLDDLSEPELKTILEKNGFVKSRAVAPNIENGIKLVLHEPLGN